MRRRLSGQHGLKGEHMEPGELTDTKSHHRHLQQIFGHLVYEQKGVP